MPNTALQLREGTSVEHASFAGASGELTYDSDKNTVVIHDGSTLGGFPLARAGQPPVSRDVEGTHANGQLFISSTNVAYWKLDGQWFEVGPLISATTASDLP